MNSKRRAQRTGGIICHPTSLPGPNGIGELGDEAFQWLDWLQDSGCHLWQVLPLGPTGYGDSPYQSFSALAGNPLLISLQRLLADGLLSSDDIQNKPEFPDEYVDFGPVIEYKDQLLHRAWENFHARKAKHLNEEFKAFYDKNADWLQDFAIFMTLKGANDGNPWPEWDVELRKRRPGAIEKVIKKFKNSIEDHCFRQFLFFRQWKQLYTRAHELGIQIIGDVPIFLAHDSCDVWMHQELFFLDAEGHPSVVAGVPPDYFSTTGQRWGNPLYRWDRLREDGYRWWIQRLESVLEWVDFVRLDHFRGFEAYWEIPASAPTAETGRWVKGPGSHLFSVLKDTFHKLPIIAEDLGVITPEVDALREQFNLPGMRVLQFAFDECVDNPFLPHNYPQNCIVYTGTHDNNTTKGWYESASEEVQEFCRKYLATDGEDIAWDIIRAAWSSVADMAIAPLQDFLSLGDEARMNFPSKAEGNWIWRVQAEDLSKSLAERIKELNFLYGR